MMGPVYGGGGSGVGTWTGRGELCACSHRFSVTRPCLNTDSTVVLLSGETSEAVRIVRKR